MQDCVGTVDVEKVLSAASLHVWQQCRVVCMTVLLRQWDYV